MNIRNLVVARLTDHLSEIKSFVDGLPGEQLVERPHPDQWSLFEITHHLADLQTAYIEMASRILIEDRPKLELVCPENHSDMEFPERELKSRLKEFDEQRKNLISLLAALTEKQWKREGQHPEILHFNIEKCMEELMRHEESHLYEMYRIFFGVRNTP